MPPRPISRRSGSHPTWLGCGPATIAVAGAFSSSTEPPVNWLVENRTPTLIGVDESLESATERLVTATGRIEVDKPIAGIGLRQCGVEDVAFANRRALR